MGRRSVSREIRDISMDEINKTSYAGYKERPEDYIGHQAGLIPDISPQVKKPPSVRRICLYGGPGTGKTTTASDLFAEIKRNTVANKVEMQFELTQEWVKQWAWEGRKPQGFDQNFIFANQQRLEEIPLRNGVDCIITDSPLLLSAAYARKYHVKSWQALISLAELHEAEYPGLHIFLDRGDRPYVAKGRFQNEEEAKKMDGFIRGMLDLFIGSDRYVTLPYGDFPAIYSCVRGRLGI